MKRPLILVFLAAVTLGCRASPTTQEAQAALSPDGVLLEVAVEGQAGDKSCGLACLRSFLAFHQVLPDDTLRQRLSPERIEAEGGVRAGELRDELRRLGFRAALVKGTLNEERPAGLFYLLRRQLPAIVELVVEEEGEDSRHFVLVCGFDPEKQWVFAMDPARGLGAIPYKRFEGLWAAADHLCLVAAPPRQKK